MSKNPIIENTIVKDTVLPAQEASSAEVVSKEPFSWRLAYTAWFAFAGILLVCIAAYYFDELVLTGETLVSQLNSDFLIFMMAGFVAQMIDGALGMAYGVSASTFLLSFGVSPAAASASIHTSEIFTSGVSGLMHLKFQNVNKKLFRTLLLPGIIGAALGAYVLSSLEEYNYILKPVIACYTLYLGIVIVRKAIVGVKTRIKTKRIPRLATFGGFMDSVGGGGWGPIVSSTLIAGGRHPRYTIGSVNLAEFFVALSSSLTFLFVIGLSHWQIITGLIFGGVIAAPIAAFLSKRIPVKRLMIMVGVMVILVSIRIIVVSFNIL